MSDKILGQFDLVIRDYKIKNQVLNTKIFTIEKSEITSAKMEGNYALITVRFLSKQINYITDTKGAVVDGSKEEVNSISDAWTFKKDITSPNPNWLVVSTDSK